MKTPVITLSLSTVMVALFVFFGGAPTLFTWISDTAYIEQFWRLISAHFVHSDVEHLVWNVAAFTVLGAIIEQRSKRDLLLSIIAGVVAVNVYLLGFYSLSAYVGLSGVLNSVLTIALFHLYQQPAYRMAALLTAVLSMAKIVFELSSGQSVFTSLVWPPVPQAHLAGWLGGAALVLITRKSRLELCKQKSHKKAIDV